MPQYVVLQSHPPGDCPVASKAAREWVKKMFPQMQRIAEEMGVKFVIPYLHLDPAHKGLLVLEAPSAETVRDFVVRAGHFHYLDMELYLVTPISDLLQHMDEVPTIYP
jgi:hypothetical protein